MKKVLLTLIAVAFALVVVPKLNPVDGIMQVVHAATGNNTAAPFSLDIYLLSDDLANTEPGETLTVTKDMGVNTLSSYFAREFEERKIALYMEYTYNGTDYAIMIPAGTELDPSIPWYGPLYLYSYFAADDRPEHVIEGAAYEIKVGDTMYGIASRYGLSITHLQDLNPEIAAQQYIYPGQQLRLQ